MVSAPPLHRIDYAGYNAWDQVGFKEAAYAGSDLASRIEDAAALVVSQGYDKLIVPAPPSGLNNILRKIVLPGTISYDLQGEIHYSSVTNEAAVEIGTAGTQLYKQTIRCWVTRSGIQTDWTSTAAIGLLLHNPFNCKLDIAAEYFTIGAEFRATNLGISHNYVYLNRFTNNRYGIKIYTATAGNSWVNQNTFVDGRWQMESDKRLALGNPAAGVMDPTGVWMDGLGTGINNNLFLNPSFELAGAAGGANTIWPQIKPWLLDTHATANRMIMARHESDWPAAQVDPHIARPFMWVNSVNVSGNDVELGYTSDIRWRESDLIAYIGNNTGRHLGNRVYSRYNDSMKAPKATSSWTSGKLADKCKQYNAAGSMWLPGAYWSSSTFRQEYQLGTGATVDADKLILPGGADEAICWLIDTTVIKRLMIQVDTDDDDDGVGVTLGTNIGFRIALKALSGTNVILGSAGDARPYLDFIGADWQAGILGGCYRTNTWTKHPLVVAIKNEVKKVEVCILQTGANAADIKAVTISALDHGPLQVSNWFGGYDNVTNYAAVTPASGWKGNWKTGEVIRNRAASAAGDAWGWRCRGDGANFDALIP